MGEWERENIKQAVRLGKATVFLLDMLEEVKGKVQRLRAELAELEAEPKAEAAIQLLPGLVERYAHDLRATLSQDTVSA